MRSKIKLIGAAIDACASTKGSADTPDILNAKWLPALSLKFDQILHYTDGRNDVAKLETYFLYPDDERLFLVLSIIF